MLKVLPVLAASVAALVGAPTPHEPPSLAVTVNGAVREVAPGSTLGELTSRPDLRPHAGNLVGPRGRVLRSGVYPSHIALNGQPAAPTTLLRTGDLVRIESGRDHREPLSRTINVVVGGMASDPQFSLARAPAERIAVVGDVSGVAVSTTVRPTGPAWTPAAVALTFDDGPSQYTAQVVRVLRRLHVPATFFVVGSQAAFHPDLVRLEARSGFTIGDHSWSHPRAFASLGSGRVRSEISTTEALLARARIHAELFRPPGGSDSPQIVEVARDLGQRVVIWTDDPRDWEPGITPGQIEARVVAALRPGAIVLLHDGGGDRSATVAALPSLVRAIRARGLRFVALGPPAWPRPPKRPRVCELCPGPQPTSTR